MRPLLALLCLIALWALDVFWGGYVAAVLWDWFLVPLGVAKITYWHAAGLAALLSVMLGNRGISQASKDGELNNTAFTFLCAAMVPAIGLLSGWIAHHYMG